MKEKVVFCWSGGKDSAMALYELLRGGAHEVVALLSTVNGDYGRVAMHGVREELLERQAVALGLPLEKVYLSRHSSNEEYEAGMAAALEKCKTQGVSTVAFGDIFLEDLKKYREDNLARAGMKAHFPIWERETADLARTFISLGFGALITCVDTQALDGEFCGRPYDAAFLADLPETVDPCGENGEFHSFVHAGPLFCHPIAVKTGEIVLRDDRFAFCDLLPA